MERFVNYISQSPAVVHFKNKLKFVENPNTLAGENLGYINENMYHCF